MNNKAIDILGILRKCSVFQSLTQAQLRELAGKARIEQYSERTLLTLRGELPEHIRYIVSGSIDLVLSTAEGGYSSLPMLEGRWATWLGCFGSEPLVHDLWSSNNATYVAIASRDVNKAVANNPEALREVIEQVGEWARFLTGWMLSFAAYGPEKRLVYLLLPASPEACSITQERLPTAVTQTHIGQFGFGSRQKVSRLPRGLADKGLIQSRRTPISGGPARISRRARRHTNPSSQFGPSGQGCQPSIPSRRARQNHQNLQGCAFARPDFARKQSFRAEDHWWRHFHTRKPRDFS